MKFSVLLPTRNRLELLRSALNSVLQQDYNDWEVIVYDNFSEQDILSYVNSLNDSRVKYFRTTSFVNVTENWNNALEKSSGDYVIMLGDDDCLMKGYFSTIIRLLEEYPDPDFIYASAFLYAYPGVFPDIPDGFLHAFGNATFLHKKNVPFLLDKQEALRCVDYTMNFRVMYGFNMQYSLISRKLIDELQVKGKFFQSPYPDYYATTSMMLNANRILACPFPLVTIGISPKSFGYYYVNRREQVGVDFLQNNVKSSISDNLNNVILPGTDMNTSWLVAMETVKINFNDVYKLKVNYQRYRFIQIVRVIQDYILNSENCTSLLSDLKNKLRWNEKIVLSSCVCLLSLLFTIFKNLSRRNVSGRLTGWINSHMDFHCQAIEGKYKNLDEVFESIDPANVKQKM